MEFTSQLRVVEETMLMIRKDGLSQLESTKNYLESLYERLTAKVIPAIRPPKAPVAMAETLFLYVHVVCDYYNNVKTLRDLTEEERGVGKKLNELLGSTMNDVKLDMVNKSKKA